MRESSKAKPRRVNGVSAAVVSLLVSIAAPSHKAWAEEGVVTLIPVSPMASAIRAEAHTFSTQLHNDTGDFSSNVTDNTEAGTTSGTTSAGPVGETPSVEMKDKPKSHHKVKAAVKAATKTQHPVKAKDKDKEKPEAPKATDYVPSNSVVVETAPVAQAVEQSRKSAAKATAEHAPETLTTSGKTVPTVDLGKNPNPNEPIVTRYDDDENQIHANPSETSGSKIYLGGPVPQKHGEDSVRYVYASRGGWLIRHLQPYLDRLGLEVIKADSSTLTAGYMDAQRSYAYLCLLIATDDASDKMLQAIGNAVSAHREAISHLSLQWPRKKADDVSALFNDYIQATYIKNLDKEIVHIPAGSLSSTQYKSLSESYVDRTYEEAGGLKKTFNKLIPKGN